MDLLHFLHKAEAQLNKTITNFSPIFDLRPKWRTKITITRGVYMTSINGLYFPRKEVHLALYKS